MSLLSRLALPLILLLAACAGSPERNAAGSAEQHVDALYARLDGHSRAWLEAGGAAAGAGDSAAALDAIQADAARCARTRGCDLQRFVAALDTLLRGDAANGLAGEEALAVDSGQRTAGERSPAVTAVPELARTITHLKGRELGEIIAVNDAVKVAIEEWLSQHRPNLQLAYENYQFMRAMMWPEYERAGLPEALLFAMMAQESGGRVHAVSRSGASGPLQFMYATGQRFGLGTRDGFDQRFDPKLSARANAAYINEQLAIFNDNLELVIGAYNGGEGAMRRRVARAGGPQVSFWDPKIQGDLSAETRDYVPRVLAAAWLFLHPERYNLEFPALDPAHGQVILAEPASLTALSVCLGQEGGQRNGWFRTLRNLNPHLDPHRAEPAGTRIVLPRRLEAAYARNCTQGPWRALAQDLQSATRPAAPAARGTPGGARATATRRYTVRKGDTLMAIVRSTGCGDVRTIAARNGLRPPAYLLHPGQVLELPGCKAR